MSNRIILKGRTEMLKPVITQILALNQMFENLDIGQFVGYPVSEYVRREKVRESNISLRLQWFDIKSPPFKVNRRNSRRVTYNIPSVKRSALEWDKIKLAMGGGNGYIWGRFRATASLSDGGQMQCHGGSKQEAEERLKALLELSEAKILTLSIAEEEKEGLRLTDPKLYKESTRVYPGYATIINKEKIITESINGRGTLDGNFGYRDKRFPMYLETKPSNFETTVQELLRVRGSAPNAS